MRRQVTYAVLLVLALTFVAVMSFASGDDVVKAVVDARGQVTQLALPSGKLPDLTLDKAYDLQKKVVAAIVAKGDKIGGFKGGLTSKAGQERFGVDRALWGPLFASGKLESGAVVDSKKYVRVFLETEVGYAAGQKISEPVKDVEALKKMVKEVFAAIEIPDLRFDDMKGLKGVDLVVDAVSCSMYIVGKPIPADKLDLNEVKVTMTLDGATVNEGVGRDAMGDQWQALLWLVNEAVKGGYTIEPGQIFITGALGKMIPGKPGKYEANFGALGSIKFDIK